MSWQLARQALAAVPFGLPLYARVDLIRDRQRPAAAAGAGTDRAVPVLRPCARRGRPICRLHPPFRARRGRYRYNQIRHCSMDLPQIESHHCRTCLLLPRRRLVHAAWVMCVFGAAAQAQAPAARRWPPVSIGGHGQDRTRPGRPVSTTPTATGSRTRPFPDVRVSSIASELFDKSLDAAARSDRDGGQGHERSGRWRSPQDRRPVRQLHG